MSDHPSPMIDPVVIRARQRLKEGREKIRQRHDEGGSGPDICSSITDLVDTLILDIWGGAISGNNRGPLAKQVALVAHGGYGRRDLAPFSDVDLMLITSRAIFGEIQPIASTVSRNIVDAGLQLGFSVRMPDEACRLAWKDPVIYSSLTESRYLAGSVQVYEGFFDTLRRGARRRSKRLVREVTEARRQERVKWGETNYLLRPNVKRSRGGLRDLQLIRWIGFARQGETDLARLVELGGLPKEDYQRVVQAQDFLLRLRNELHFIHGRSHDILDRAVQMRISEKWGYAAEAGRLPVEMFMQEYFEHTRNVRYASAYVCDDARVTSWWYGLFEWAFSRSEGQRVRSGSKHVWVPARHLPGFASNLAAVLRLMDIANKQSKRISHRTWQAIRSEMGQRPPGLPDADAVRSFLSLMSRPGRLPELLRQLHELRVLEQFVPAMRRARGLLQFNEYHKYTVDRHCIRAVEAATQFEAQTGPYHELYRRLDDKLLLHLSLLIHDLGKGFPEDHSEVGKQIAAETASLLKLDQDCSETLQWLVHKHLIMHYAAFRHDLNDPQIISRFANDVGSVRRLELLTLMSIADLTAVGPDVLTGWKGDLIEELYGRTKAFLETGLLPGQPSQSFLKRRGEIRDMLKHGGASARALAFLEELPESAVLRPPPEFVADLIRDSVDADPQPEAICRGRFDVGRGAAEYTVVMRQKDQPIGIFARATGALAATGLSILKAEIATLSDGWIWDTFLVEDYDSAAKHDAHIAYTGERVTEILSGQKPLPPLRKYWSATSERDQEKVKLQPAEVNFDNETTDRYTIILLFAYDRPGLLARVAAVLANLKVVLHFAKIDTHLDQAVDVFYVSELDDSKIISAERLQQIRAELLEAVNRRGD